MFDLIIGIIVLSMLSSKSGHAASYPEPPKLLIAIFDFRLALLSEKSEWAYSEKKPKDDQR